MEKHCSPRTPKSNRGSVGKAGSILRNVCGSKRESWRIFLTRGCRLFRRDPVNLFAQEVLGEPDSLQDTLPVLDHLRVPAEISDTILRSDSPLIGVLADQLIDAADFAIPLRVVPRTAHGRHVLEPRRVLGVPLQLIDISEFPRSASSVQQKQFMIALEFAFLPILIERSHKAYKGSNSGDR